MIQAIGTPMTMHITTAMPQNSSELTMNLGVSMLTCSKNSSVYSSGSGVSDQPRPTAASRTPTWGIEEMIIREARKPTAIHLATGPSRRRSTFEYDSEL